MKWQWTRKRSRKKYFKLCCHQVLAICIDLASICYTHTVCGGGGWIIEPLFVIRVKLKQQSEKPDLTQHTLCICHSIVSKNKGKMHDIILKCLIIPGLNWCLFSLLFIYIYIHFNYIVIHYKYIYIITNKIIEICFWGHCWNIVNITLDEGGDVLDYRMETAQINNKKILLSADSKLHILILLDLITALNLWSYNCT